MQNTRFHPYLRRCFELARRGAGQVSPNPLVGAVVAHEDRIIGEGWHQRYGQAHAEVNALNSVAPEDRHLIPQSTLYCSLEPCFHHGKTPPCVERVMQEKLLRVVISNVDPNPLVAGQSVARMRAAGIEVITGVLEQEGAELNRVFFTSVTHKRPFVVLKWAQSADGFIGRVGERTTISGPVAQRLVHRWRSELDAMLVGAQTARVDNPRLDARLVHGRPPLRIALDQKGDIPQTHHLFDDSQPTWILGPKRQGEWAQTLFMPVPASWEAFLYHLYDHRIASLLVEGGASVLRQFMEAGLWDEMRVLENPRLVLGDGIVAPRTGAGAIKVSTMDVGGDHVSVYTPFSQGLQPQSPRRRIPVG